MRVKKLLILAAAAVILALVAGTASAQHDHAGSGCDRGVYNNGLATVSELVVMARQALENNDPNQTMQMVAHIQRIASSILSYCMNMVFRSENEGLEAVVGPVAFVDGVYVARIISNGALTVQLNTLSGECDNAAPLFTLAPQQAMAPDGDVAAFSPRGCTASIEVRSAEPWLLMFEPVGVNMAQP